MAKKIIFTVLLLMVGAASFYFGLNPFGPFINWQDQNTETETGIQKSLTAKSEQVFNVWGANKSVHGTINVLQSADTSAVYTSVNPVDILEPYNKLFNRVSGLLLFTLGTLLFEKMLLAVIISAVFLILIPICVLISVWALWRYKSPKGLYKILIVSVLISVVMPFAIPASFKLSTLTDEKLLSANTEFLVSSITENTENAEKMESELKGLRRVGVTVGEYISNAQNIGNAVVKDIINYLIIFLITHILIPVFVLVGLYKLLKYSSKLILK